LTSQDTVNTAVDESTIHINTAKNYLEAPLTDFTDIRIYSENDWNLVDLFANI